MQSATSQNSIGQAFLAELEQETAITKRLFDVIPEDKLAWRPHPKAKSLGELAMHIASTQGQVAQMTTKDTYPIEELPRDPAFAGLASINSALEESVSIAKSVLVSTDDARAQSDFTITMGGNEVMRLPRAAVWRMIMLSHYIHHRGQLSTYIRELDVPLPSIYGPSADSNPFA